MKSKEIKYFEWLDIQEEICKEMNITIRHFREYHEIVGGEHKDLWYEWMQYFDTVTKDTISPNELGESLEAKLEWIREDKKEWLEPFVKAVYRVWGDNEIEYVGYFW